MKTHDRATGHRVAIGMSTCAACLLGWLIFCHAAMAQEISIADLAVNESDGTATLSVTLSPVSTEQVTAQWHTSDYSTTGGSDYAAASDTLIIPANTGSANITINLVNDDTPEIDEIFNVILSNPVNATIQDGEASVTILENDLQTLTWDDGTSDAGNQVYTHPDTSTGTYVFRINTQATTVGAWRTMLKLTTGEAQLYLAKGYIPSVGNYHFKSERTGSDGLVLASDQFSASEAWYATVVAQAGAAWQLVTGEAFVQNLGMLGFTDINADTNYDIGEPVTPTESGSVEVGIEGIRFFRVSVPGGSPAWSLWLNGDSRNIAVRKNQVPLHDQPYHHDKLQSGQMLIVPPIWDPTRPPSSSV